MSQPRLLIVEDDEASQIQLKYALKGEFSLIFASEESPSSLGVQWPSRTVFEASTEVQILSVHARSRAI